MIPVLREQLTNRLKHHLPEQEKKQIHSDLEALNMNYSSIYLVFDSEFQHTPGKTSDCQKTTLSKNYQDLKEMIDFFNNETEQGKLYINYPMMESYRDCNKFFDEDYQNRFVTLENLFGQNNKPSYKALVASRSRLASFRTDSLTSVHFNQLILMNVFKLYLISNNQWEKPSYQKFREISDQKLILNQQKEFCDRQYQIAVLNTLMFFMIDYKGLDFYNFLSPSEALG